ncbi:MAG: ammonium transporter [Acidimicrobiales bacterium]
MSAGDTAWMLVATALVLFMTPGVALFYGGLVRAKNVLAIMMQSFLCISLVSVAWALFVFSLAFGADAGGGLIGNLGLVGLGHLGGGIPGLGHLHVPPLVYAAFQMMFAVVTAALITGGSADRLKLSGFVVFILLWTVVVYGVLAHWVFSPSGWLAHRGVLDFAGGSVVEINSGFSALALALVVGRRRGWPGEAMAPHSVPISLLGAGILWFGWFGFNAGSALGANAVAVQALVNTQLAASAGLLGWLGVERLKDGRATTLGAVSGAVAGMVGITAGAGYMGALPALLVGVVSGAAAALAVRLKFRLGYDDSLDVLGVHGVGGVLGLLFVGVFAARGVDPAASNGLASGGGLRLLGEQALATVVSAVFCFGMSWLLAQLVQRTIGLRVPPDAEAEGLDLALHSESAYSTSGMGRIGR